MHPESNLRICLGILAMLGCIGAVLAEEGKEKPVEVGASTTAILDLQRSGVSPGKLQPISGEVANRSYQRYLESFTQPLPEYRAANQAPSRAASGGAR